MSATHEAPGHLLLAPAPSRSSGGRARRVGSAGGQSLPGSWRIDIEWRDGVPRLLPATVLARAAAAALDAAGAPSPASIGLILSSDSELAELNEAHMGKHGPTDVLSFPLLPPAAFPGHPGKAPTQGRPR